MTGRITARQFHEAAGVGDWRVLGEGACAYFRTGSFEAGARLVQAIAELGGLDDHPPDVDLRHEGVTVRLITIADGYYGLSERDVELARQISAVARELGIPADPSAVQSLQIAIDALVRPEVMPFWRAVLGYRTAATATTTSSTRAAARRCSGSSRWTRRARNATASTSTSGCRMTRPRSGSPPRSRPAACW